MLVGLLDCTIVTGVVGAGFVVNTIIDGIEVWAKTVPQAYLKIRTNV